MSAQMRKGFERAFCPATSQNGDDPARWLADKIKHYEAEVTRLEAQLKHAQVLLRGHQVWLADVERRKGGNR